MGWGVIGECAGVYTGDLAVGIEFDEWLGE
jgi:hypothetical protein